LLEGEDGRVVAWSPEVEGSIPSSGHDCIVKRDESEYKIKGEKIKETRVRSETADLSQQSGSPQILLMESSPCQDKSLCKFSWRSVHPFKHTNRQTQGIL